MNTSTPPKLSTRVLSGPRRSGVSNGDILNSVTQERIPDYLLSDIRTWQDRLKNEKFGDEAKLWTKTYSEILGQDKFLEHFLELCEEIRERNKVSVLNLK